jgi:hypothetical protein
MERVAARQIGLKDEQSKRIEHPIAGLPVDKPIFIIARLTHGRISEMEHP